MKFSLLLLLLPFFAFAGGKGEKVEKEINRQFSINSNGVLMIDNKYGSVDVTTGTANQISINVVISVDASSHKKAQDVLDGIDVKFEEGDNKVSAKTEIGSSATRNSWFSNDSKNIEINYTVVVPADIYLELRNKYGSIYVETTDKDLNVDLAYGDIRLGDINADVKLDMAYSEGSLSNIKNALIKLGYSELEMEDAASVEVRMQYTEMAIGNATSAKVDASYSEFDAGSLGSLTYTGKYDDVAVEQVGTIKAKSNYSDMEVGALSQAADITMTYGELEIENIAAGFSKIEIQSSYTDVSLEFDDRASFSLDAQTSYCDINHDDFDIVEQIEKGSSSTLRATKGSGNGQVMVKMTYGELEID